jgi:hypothetical protein
MPCLLWTIDKKRATRHKLVCSSAFLLISQANALARLTFMLFWLCMHAPGQQFIGRDSSVQSATSPLPAKTSSWTSLWLQGQKNIPNRSLLELSCSGVRLSHFFMREGGVKTLTGVASLVLMKRYFYAGSLHLQLHSVTSQWVRKAFAVIPCVIVHIR